MGRVMCFENDGCKCFMMPKFLTNLGIREEILGSSLGIPKPRDVCVISRGMLSRKSQEHNAVN